METTLGRKSMKQLCLAVFLCAFAISPAFADTEDSAVFRTRMLPDNEVPPIAAAGNSASATITVHVSRDGRGNISSAQRYFRYRLHGNCSPNIHRTPHPQCPNRHQRADGHRYRSFCFESRCRGCGIRPNQPHRQLCVGPTQALAG